MGYEVVVDGWLILAVDAVAGRWWGGTIVTGFH